MLALLKMPQFLVWILGLAGVLDQPTTQYTAEKPFGAPQVIGEALDRALNKKFGPPQPVPPMPRHPDFTTSAPVPTKPITAHDNIDQAPKADLPAGLPYADDCEDDEAGQTTEPRELKWDWEVRVKREDIPPFLNKYQRVPSFGPSPEPDPSVPPSKVPWWLDWLNTQEPTSEGQTLTNEEQEGSGGAPPMDVGQEWVEPLNSGEEEARVEVADIYCATETELDGSVSHTEPDQPDFTTAVLMGELPTAVVMGGLEAVGDDSFIYGEILEDSSNIDSFEETTQTAPGDSDTYGKTNLLFVA